MTEKERVYKLLWELSRRDDMVAVQPYELRVLLEDLELSNLETQIFSSSHSVIKRTTNGKGIPSFMEYSTSITKRSSTGTTKNRCLMFLPQTQPNPNRSKFSTSL